MNTASGRQQELRRAHRLLELSVWRLCLRIQIYRFEINSSESSVERHKCLTRHQRSLRVCPCCQEQDPDDASARMGLVFLRPHYPPQHIWTRHGNHTFLAPSRVGIYTGRCITLHRPSNKQPAICRRFRIITCPIRDCWTQNRVRRFPINTHDPENKFQSLTRPTLETILSTHHSSTLVELHGRAAGKKEDTFVAQAPNFGIQYKYRVASIA